MRLGQAGARAGGLKRWTSSAAVAVAMCLSAPLTSVAQTMAFGQARTVSLGLAGSATHWRVACLGTTVCDRNDSGWRLTGAWQFAPQGALELVAADQGRVRSEGLGDSGLRTSELRMRGTGVNLAWLLPLTPDWLFTARAGAIGNRARFIETAGPGAPSEESSRTRTDPTLGLGVSWRLSPAVSVDGRLDWTSSRLAPATTSLLGSGSTPSHQWGLGLTAYF
jgi:hypothetical protein